jgi:hypothetical protein
MLVLEVKREVYCLEKENSRYLFETKEDAEKFLKELSPTQSCGMMGFYQTVLGELELFDVG